MQKLRKAGIREHETYIGNVLEHEKSRYLKWKSCPESEKMNIKSQLSHFKHDLHLSDFDCPNCNYSGGTFGVASSDNIVYFAFGLLILLIIFATIVNVFNSENMDPRMVLKNIAISLSILFSKKNNFNIDRHRF